MHLIMTAIDGTTRSVLLRLGRKCTLAASRAVPLMSHDEYAPRALLTIKVRKKTPIARLWFEKRRDRRTDGRTPHRNIMLSAKCGKRNKGFVTG